MITLRPLAALTAGLMLTLAACGGGDDTGDGTGDGTGSAPAGDVTMLQFTSRDNFAFDPPTATVAAGEVHVMHENAGATTHTFVIEGEFRLVDDDDKTVELSAGEYTYYCDVPGHREAGMEGTLTVTP